MANRLIRDGLLESEAVLNLPVEARWLYLSILLSADDVGLFDANAFKLARRADVSRGGVDRLLTMLVDEDLVRIYMAEGKRYGFIPRYRQRLQIKRIKHPVPPDALLRDDDDAKEKFSKINELTTKTTVGQPLSTAAQPPEPEPEPEEQFCLNESGGRPEPKTPRGRGVRTRVENRVGDDLGESKRGRRLDDDWRLPKAWGDWVLSELAGWTPERVRSEGEKFGDYWHAKTGQAARKRDWLATWRNWCRNARPAPVGRAPGESFRQSDERRAAERVRELTGGLCHDRVAAGEAAPMRALPFAPGYVGEVGRADLLVGCDATGAIHAHE